MNWRKTDEAPPKVPAKGVWVLGRWTRDFAPVQAVFVQLHPFNPALPYVWRCGFATKTYGGESTRIDEQVDPPDWWTEIPE